eukprot:7004954-Pyramimonas_sp.AAC.1
MHDKEARLIKEIHKLNNCVNDDAGGQVKAPATTESTHRSLATAFSSWKVMQELVARIGAEGGPRADLSGPKKFIGAAGAIAYGGIEEELKRYE